MKSAAAVCARRQSCGHISSQAACRPYGCFTLGKACKRQGLDLSPRRCHEPERPWGTHPGQHVAVSLCCCHHSRPGGAGGCRHRTEFRGQGSAGEVSLLLAFLYVLSKLPANSSMALLQYKQLLLSVLTGIWPKNRLLLTRREKNLFLSQAEIKTLHYQDCAGGPKPPPRAGRAVSSAGPMQRARPEPWERC